jgi:hypothetical protein
MSAEALAGRINGGGIAIHSRRNRSLRHPAI